MPEIVSSQDSNQKLIPEPNEIQLQDDTEKLNHCCMSTIDSLSHINSMMVCGDCKQIIKTFSEEKNYRNYVKFCQSRSRPVTTGVYRNQYVVIFI